MASELLSRIIIMIRKLLRALVQRPTVGSIIFLAAMLSANAITSAEPVGKNPDNHESLSKIVESLKQAWNKNDADRIAELFLPDAILVLPTGSVTRSRSEIRQRVLAEWRGKLKDSQLSYAVEDVSVLNNDTAVVTGKYRLSGVKILGFDQAPEGPFIFRHKKQRGHWMISKAEILRHKAEQTQITSKADKQLVKIKALENWPPQEWRSEAQTLAPENALDAADVSASVEVNRPGVLTLSVTHNDQRYGASLSLPAQLATKVALIISGASPNKPLREIGELEIDSELSQ